MPGKRRNMNLSDKLFKRWEIEKARMEKSLGVPVSWDVFFGRHLDELKKFRGPK